MAHLAWQVGSASAENCSPAGKQQDAGAHRENLERRRLQCHDADSRAAPLPQILDKEEGVKDIHAVGRLIEHQDGALREKLTSDI